MTVARIATGEQEEQHETLTPAQQYGRMGGLKRAAILSAVKQRHIARDAAARRWWTRKGECSD